MATTQPPTTGKQNTIEGKASLTVTIRDLRAAKTLIDEILSQKDTVSKITSVVIEDDKYGHELDDTPAQTRYPSLVTGDGDESAQEEHDPLASLLSGLSNAGCALKSFTWKECPRENRSALFWASLYRHASTLQMINLHLGLGAYEIPPLPQKLSFPALRELKVKASRAFGSDGSFIDGLLKASPGLEVLCFDWPEGPDFSRFSVTWDYEFPALKRLELSGKDSDPAALRRFIARCESVEDFRYSVGEDVRYLLDGTSSSAYVSKTQLLPNLRSLTITERMEAYPLSTWLFPTTEARPLTHLRIDSYYDANRFLKKLALLPPTSLDCIKVLHIRSPAFHLFPDEYWDMKMTPLARALQLCLPHFTQLEELHLGDGDKIWYHGIDPVMEEKHLHSMLGLLPTEKTTLRRLKMLDVRGIPLSAEVLEDLQNVPEGLEELSWEGKVKASYRFKREGGRVRAVKFDEDWILI